MNILGISALYHDSAAALIHDGEIVAAAQEERFTRKKADASIPENAIKYCLSMMVGELDAVVYYDDPILTIDRWLNNAIMVAEDNDVIVEKSFNALFSERIWVHERLRRKIGSLGKTGRLLVCEHHISHAASAFFPSPFEKAAIITMDGVGEWATTTIGVGDGNELHIIEQMNYPDSIGLLYSAFTYFCGFKVNFGEYKLMGLAPYGKPVYYDVIMDNIVDLKEDGSIKLNQKYFSYLKNTIMTGTALEELLGIKKRIPEEKITAEYMDLAASIQKVTEEIVIRLARHAKAITNEKNLVLAGGIALNCVANGKLLKEGIFDEIWIQPAAGDAGGAIGAALYAYYGMFHQKRAVKERNQISTYLGPEYSNSEIELFLKKKNLKYTYYNDERIFDVIADALATDKVIGIHHGRMEFGPRALGNRSIIANPMSSEMQSKLNLKIKYRESFRPFAPAVLMERSENYFDLNVDSPYMLLVAPVREELRDTNNVFGENSIQENNEDLLKIVHQKRSTIPAVTHVDYSARIQTVTEEGNEFFHKVIKAFEKKTGCGCVVNTSFNVRGEPIVCTPEDAYLCFMRTDMDMLVLGNYILKKEEQEVLEDNVEWRTLYELD